jgi:hypothetical protein
MTHKYPFGAIESEQPLLMGLLGQTLYGVHGLGSSSFLTVMQNCRNLHTSVFSDGSPGFRRIEYTYDDAWDTGCCLGDFNIDAHHNQHYLFHNREDAEAYLAWALANTAEIRKNRWYDWDYGDGE